MIDAGNTNGKKCPFTTQYLRSDVTTARRAHRAKMARSLHSSLPSLSLPYTSPASLVLQRVPGDGAEEKDIPLQNDQVQKSSKSTGESKATHVPASPHPLQRARVIQQTFTPPKLPDDENETGIVDLRYTLNFSTPLLNDLPFSISAHVLQRPRVSFRDDPELYDSQDSWSDCTTPVYGSSSCSKLPVLHSPDISPTTSHPFTINSSIPSIVTPPPSFASPMFSIPDNLNSYVRTNSIDDSKHFGASALLITLPSTIATFSVGNEKSNKSKGNLNKQSSETDISLQFKCPEKLDTLINPVVEYRISDLGILYPNNDSNYGEKKSCTESRNAINSLK